MRQRRHGWRGRRAAVIAAGLGWAAATASAAHGQASFRPRFEAQAPLTVSVGPNAGRQALALADVNGDQRPDLVVVAPAGAGVDVHLNDGGGAFAAAVRYDLELSPRAVAVADVASPIDEPGAGGPDGLPDLLVGGDRGLHILRGLGDGRFVDQDDPRQPGGLSAVVGLAVGEFDGSGGADLAVLDADGVLLLCNADGVLAPCAGGARLAVGDDPIEILGGDFNGDGRGDLVVLDRAAQLLFPFFGAGDGTVTSGDAVSVRGETPDGIAVDMVVARVDDDAIDDVIVVNDDDNLQFIAATLLGSERSRFRVLLFVIDFQASAVAVGDFDGDDASLTDVIVGYRDGGITINAGVGGGELADPFAPVGGNTIGTVALLAAADLNGDGLSDLVRLHGPGDDVRVLLNATPLFCVGDCNANSAVSIDELMRGVNIALGILDVRDCLALDLDGDNQIAIHEVIAAVSQALIGCPMG